MFTLMTWLATPLCPIALALGVGIALGSWLDPSIALACWLAATGAAAILVVLDRRLWATGALIASVAMVGALHVVPAPLPSDHVAHVVVPRVARLEGRIAAEPVRFARDRQRVILDVERLDEATASGRVQMNVYGDAPALDQGQRIAVEARLRPAEGFRNPEGFDYGAFLRRQDIHVVATASGDRVTILDDARPWHVRVKRRALASIESALPPVSSALLGGLLLGARSDLPRETLEDFRRAGVYHVLAVSGFNVALVAGAAFTAALIVRASRRIAAGAAIVVVIGFAFVVGPEPSVVRAAVMGVLVLAALLLDRDAYVLNSLALAAIVVLSVRPTDLLDPGFQLSFAATAGIVLVPMPRGAVAGALAVSLAAQVAVLPITLSHFNQVSLIGIVANLAVVPLAAVATVLGVIAVAIAFVSDAVAAPFFDAVWPILLLLRAAVKLAAGVPGALVHLPAPHWAAIVAYVASLVLALTAWRSREARPRLSRLAAAIGFWLMAGACAIAAWPILKPGDGKLRITVLDVGQGDAIVVEGPDRRTLLLDAGSGGPTRLDAGERVVAPYLWNHGILTLDAAIVTHGDVDHAGGMTSIDRLFPVREHLGPRYDGAPRRLGPVVLTLENAIRSAGATRNDQALVVRLDYVVASFLFASDIGALAERALLARGTPLGAVVLKVGHHGSRSSTTPEFLSAVRPAVAVISVGARNSYGHPSPETLARLEKVAARVYRTDRDGAVILETDGRALDVTRWADRSVDRYCLDPDTPC